MYILLNLKKKIQKGSIDPFDSSRVKIGRQIERQAFLFALRLRLARKIYAFTRNQQEYTTKTTFCCLVQFWTKYVLFHT